MTTTVDSPEPLPEALPGDLSARLGRVGLLGNMNNNHFALLRFFRDLGVDAHLLKYSNELEHFAPEHDTWNWERWSPFVHQLPVSNGGIDAVFGRRAVIEDALQGYDTFVANGIAPVLFDRIGRPLELYIPYGDGVEFIIEHHWRWRKPLASTFTWLRKRMMERALVRSVETITTPGLHDHVQGTFRRLRLQPVVMPTPLLYPEPLPPRSAWSPELRETAERMEAASLTVFSHVSHIWKNLPVPHFMGGVGKRNNWLIEGFAEYVRQSGDRRAMLCLLEYGPDVPTSKGLCEKLGISHQVLWLPKMPRRDLMCLIPSADVGGSEFAGMYWGGCGWEFMAAGVPMLHQLENSGAYDSVEYPLAPFFNVHSPAEIARVLLENDRESFRLVGERARGWFRSHQGHGLARRFVELLAVTRARIDRIS